MQDKFPRLEDLETWKKCRELRIDLRQFVKMLPTEEKFKLADQLTRASRLITNYISEGYGRFHFQENIQLLRTSRGSIYECIDDLYISLDEEYISRENFNDLYVKCQECIKLLNGYIKYLKNRKDGSSDSNK